MSLNTSETKGIVEQYIRFESHIIGHGMVLDVIFLELGSHVIEENISKMNVRMFLRENHDIVVTRDEFFQDNFLALHAGADVKASPANCRGVRNQPL